MTEVSLVRKKVCKTEDGTNKFIKNEYLNGFFDINHQIGLPTKEGKENAINYYWKLKAIDWLAMSNNLPAGELEKFIDRLIDNQEIKAVFVSDKKVENQTYAGSRHQQRTRQLKPELLVH